jgi:hypothetical protein
MTARVTLLSVFSPTSMPAAFEWTIYRVTWSDWICRANSLRSFRLSWPPRAEIARAEGALFACFILPLLFRD